MSAVREQASIATSLYQSAYSESKLGLPLILSASFHLLAAWVVLFVLPTLWTQRDNPLDFIPISFIGGSGPVVPVAATDQVEPKRGEGASAGKVQPPTPLPLEVPTVPSEEHVIPLGPLTDKKTAEPTRLPNPTPTVETPPVLEAQISASLDRIAKQVAEKQSQSAALSVKDGLGEGTGLDDSALPTDGLGPMPLDPEKAAYFALVKARVERNYLGASGNSRGLREAVFLVTIEPDGRISDKRLVQSTGNSDHDSFFETAINRSNPLPALPPVFGGGAASVGLKFDPNTFMGQR